MNFTRRATILLGLATLGLLAAAASSRAAEPTPEQEKFFEEKVRPVLVANCFKCHSDKAQKGDLRLDSAEAAMAGGESGVVIVPGKPEESLLVEAINYQSLEMPPDGKLGEEAVAALTEWVRLGAPWPGGHGSGVGGPALRKGKDKLTDEDRAWWAFQPVKDFPLPLVEVDNRSRTAIDRFLLARAASQAGGLRYEEADKRTLIRRAYFDLAGLPPTIEDVEAFVADDRPDAYERLTDRLLASPRFGERWARHWLDLVRYAESDGYKADAYRPHAWRYRDYVIRALNSDKPYDRFMAEQIAGDELAPHDPDALIATGYYRVGIYEYNQRDVRTQWSVILSDITDVTADVFLGMGMSCARCHDHKFDPILQKDYYRLQAFFAPIIQRDDLPAATPEQIADYERRLAAWEEKTTDIRRQLDELERQPIANAAKAFIAKFPDDIESYFAKAESERLPLEEQLRRLASRQIVEEGGKIDFTKKLKDEKLARWKELKEQLAKFDAEKPEPLAEAMMVSDVSHIPPPVTIPGKRDPEEILPGILSVLDEGPLAYQIPSAGLNTTGRRTALAQWLGSEDNPLTPRVLVNRLWQYHFGRGLVESSSDFGRLGQPPTQPELLDYLAAEFVRGGWEMKRMHRAMVTSAAYREGSGFRVQGTEIRNPQSTIRNGPLAVSMPSRSATQHWRSPASSTARAAAKGARGRRRGGRFT
ncbi:MAG TPA: PSD1 and planctomycete cytochrome C domain-containing protein [Pirellulaceae bacterium]|nr:PSD1 and planctomycete cytochrome C domain-containing protein [Pirellulaceae bacterium]